MFESVKTVGLLKVCKMFYTVMLMLMCDLRNEGEKVVASVFCVLN